MSDDPVHINENRLDEEWVRQPALYHDYAVKVAGARNRHAEAKAELDVVFAEIDHKVRTHPSRFNLEKLTEAVVQNTVLLQREYQDALKAVNKAKYELDLFQAMVDALEHKKKGLENLVSLRLSDYFSEPRPPAGKKDKVEEMETKAVRKKGQKTWSKGSA